MGCPHRSAHSDTHTRGPTKLAFIPCVPTLYLTCQTQKSETARGVRRKSAE